MYRDPRGGHNRKNINEKFFKTWSAQMAYVLGLIFSDGTVEDVRESSRTCYWAISSKDKSLLIQIKQAVSSNHKLYIRKPRIVKFSSGKSYLCAKNYILRIGNKVMFRDLLNLGLTPRKSLILKFPEIPIEYFNFFLRGYFDGDGCITLHTPKGQNAQRVKVIFTSGCKDFLEKLSNKLQILVGTKFKIIYSNGDSYQLSYRKYDSLKILDYMYKNLEKAPFLDRKYKIYQNIMTPSQT